MFFTAAKRGQKSKMQGKKRQIMDVTPSSMYDPVEFGDGRPDGSRRMTNIYGKTAAARGEVDLETGVESRRKGRMFSWMKGDSY